jgi:hypothetical protein
MLGLMVEGVESGVCYREDAERLAKATNRPVRCAA